MAIDNASLTPQQRLAVSRRALFGYLDVAIDRELADSSSDLDARGGGHGPAKRHSILAGLPWWAVARNFAERWWRRHPANAVSQLARPVLQRYARREPLKLIAIAAGAGALLVLIKPWRLLSATALVATVLKTSDIADMVTTLMHHNMTPGKDTHE